MYGWFVVASLSLLLTFNLYFIFGHVFKLVKFIVIKFYNIVAKLYENKLFNFQSDNKII
jgi:hypothetical protein